MYPTPPSDQRPHPNHYQRLWILLFFSIEVPLCNVLPLCHHYCMLQRYKFSCFGVKGSCRAIATLWIFRCWTCGLTCPALVAYTFMQRQNVAAYKNKTVHVLYKVQIGWKFELVLTHGFRFVERIAQTVFLYHWIYMCIFPLRYDICKWVLFFI